jgi:hypothetical protein
MPSLVNFDDCMYILTTLIDIFRIPFVEVVAGII